MQEKLLERIGAFEVYPLGIEIDHVPMMEPGLPPLGNCALFGRGKRVIVHIGHVNLAAVFVDKNKPPIQPETDHSDE
jgi:hypothetical protein